MRLKDLIASNDFSAYTKRPCGLYNYHSRLGDILYPDGYYITDDHYDAIEESGVISRIAIREWLCTDTHVGFYLYFVEDIPVATMYQSGRKSNPEWNFLSTDSFGLLREFVDECKPELQENEFDIPILDEPYLRLDCSIDRAEMQINTKDLGWSAASNMPISSMRTARINLDNMDDRGKAHVIEWYTTTIEAHEVFMRTLEDPEDIKFAADSAKINLEEMRLFLEECIL